MLRWCHWCVATAAPTLAEFPTNVPKRPLTTWSLINAKKSSLNSNANGLRRTSCMTWSEDVRESTRRASARMSAHCPLSTRARAPGWPGVERTASRKSANVGSSGPLASLGGTTPRFLSSWPVACPNGKPALCVSAPAAGWRPRRHDEQLSGGCPCPPAAPPLMCCSGFWGIQEPLFLHELLEAVERTVEGVHQDLHQRRDQACARGAVGFWTISRRARPSDARSCAVRRAVASHA